MIRLTLFVIVLIVASNAQPPCKFVDPSGGLYNLYPLYDPNNDYVVEVQYFHSLNK